MSDVDFNNGFLCGIAVKGMYGGQGGKQCRCFILGPTNVNLSPLTVDVVLLNTITLIGSITEQKEDL